MLKVDPEQTKLQKRKTGIAGLDSVTGGGLPAGQATLLLGQAAAGKTVLSLQILANAIERGEAAVFVTFEESPAQVECDACSFSWAGQLLSSDRWQLLDARPRSDAQVAGEFDIEGLLSVVGATVEDASETWIVFDGIDQLLQYQPSQRAAVEQVRRISDHCEAQGWTLLLTGKANGSRMAPAHLDGIEFLLSATLILSAEMCNHQLKRSLRIAKFRGSGHVTDELPMIMDDDGIELPFHEALVDSDTTASTERVSTGIPKLDKLLDGGIYRGSSLLISGRPGTAKSTLAAHFAEAACQRGERTLYVSFDELADPYVRNLASVGVDLRSPITSGLLRFVSLSAHSTQVTEHFFALRRLLDRFEPQCLVIDPVSALLKATASEEACMVTEHLMDLVRRRGITTVLTSLTGLQDPEGEATRGQVSTIADSWMVLDYNVRAGERNRSLSIIKSRGSAHSNQQRELLLSDAGVDLADVYELGTGVVMGTARVAMENEAALKERRRKLERQQHRLELERRMELAEQERRRLEAELKLEAQESADAELMAQVYRREIIERRDPDSEIHPAQRDAGEGELP